MNLIIDIGSSRTKAAIFADNRVIGKTTADGVISVEQLQTLCNGHDIGNAMLSSVADHGDGLIQWLKQYDFIELAPETPLPVTVTYETKNSLGKDRLAAAVAANRLYPDTDVLVIDAGTCITYEFVNSNNEYEGGSISPGLGLRFKSMNDYTAHLPLLEAGEHVPLTGKNTSDAIRSGVQHGMICEVNGIIDAYRKQFPGLQVVLTGGDAPFFEKNLKCDIFVQPELVLHGLNIILEYNKKVE